MGIRALSNQEIILIILDYRARKAATSPAAEAVTAPKTIGLNHCQDGGDGQQCRVEGRRVEGVSPNPTPAQSPLDNFSLLATAAAIAPWNSTNELTTIGRTVPLGSKLNFQFTKR
ncbi:MAG: hypothetical protein M1816_000294 [Peltula sp. TS41687]|nr:MAG: hypothetical protein M1816_000294 [Peltula sp. TS41687]